MEKKVVLVTGGTKGIGAVICRKLAVAEYHVYINYRNDDPEKDILLNEIRSLGGEAELIRFDITQPGDIQAALKGFSHRKLDLLVNNAGFLKDELIYKIDFDIWHKVLETNYFGPLNLFEAMREKLSRAISPVVVNIASISGVKPRPGQAAYAVSKAMLIEWTSKMAELYENRIRFFCISPGPVNTKMIQDTKWGKSPEALNRIPLGRFIQPEEIADMVLFLGERSPVQNGFNIIYDGGFINTVRE